MRDVGVWSAACALASARLRGSRIFFVGMDFRGAAEGALRDAASEGLTLVRASDNATGFRGVKHGERRSKPFQALVWRNGKMQHLGRYATAEEAPEGSRSRSTTATTTSLCPECREPFSQREMRLQLR